MEPEELFQDKECALCAQAEVYRDKGLPEEVFYHCYQQGCACGCHERKADAIQIAKDFFFDQVNRRLRKAVSKSK